MKTLQQKFDALLAEVKEAHSELVFGYKSLAVDQLRAAITKAEKNDVTPKQVQS